jgi:hypothetical protein
MHETKARKVIAALVDRYGPLALQLGDKPELETLFLQFAKTGRRESACPAP